MATEKQFEALAHIIMVHTNPSFEKRVHETINKIKEIAIYGRRK